ncbi:MAG: transposase [Pseudomonadota bacterium]
MGTRRKRQSWSRDEKREIYQQTTVPGVSITQVARRYATNANQIHNWLKDERFAPMSETDAESESSFVELDMTAHVECTLAYPAPTLARATWRSPSPSSRPPSPTLSIRRPG